MNDFKGMGPGVSQNLIDDMRTMLEGHLSEAPFNATAALKKQRIQGMQDKIATMRKNRQRADDTATQARDQGRDDAADAAENKGDIINRNIRDLAAKIKDELGEDNSNDKSDDGEGMDKVQPKALKKKFADRKDKDIDNDGDTDSSDKFLHKKRKAISKSMKEDVSNIADVITAMWGEAADKMDDKKKQLVCEDCGKVHEGKCAEEKDGTTMTGKPMSKVEVSVKEKD